MTPRYATGNKIALITGSSRGIGRCVAMKLAEAGIFVYINYRQQEAAAEQTLAAIKKGGGAGSLCPFDVAGAVAFMVSPEADYITGQVIRINGGLYM